MEFGAYTLHELVARGGMAEIYRGSQRSGVAGFEKPVAIKKILPNLAENEEFITMLIDEARISVKLNHANIAQVYDLGRVDDAFYIAMEFISGVDLAHIIKKLSKDGYLIPLDHAVFATKELCAGLYYAHSKKDENGEPLRIVHRDISPHNVLVSHSGNVKIIDFGVAKASVKLGQTRMGVIKGKLLYMAPEQAMARPIDARADIFSAGLCLYRMLTGHLPFEADNEFQIYNNVLTKQIEPPRSRNPEIPEDLDAIVMKALARDVNQRYPDAWAVHEDLEQVLRRINPGYTQNNLARFMGQYFTPNRPKPAQKPTTVDVATEQSYPSAPNIPYEQEHRVPDTPANFSRPPAVHEEARPGEFGAGAPTVPVPAIGNFPPGMLPGMLGGNAPPPDLPSPESLGYKPTQANVLDSEEEFEGDPTIDMQLDPDVLAQMGQLAQQRHEARAKVPGAAPAGPVPSKAPVPTAKGSGGLKLGVLLLVILGVLIALGAIGGVVAWQMGAFGAEETPPNNVPAKPVKPTQTPPPKTDKVAPAKDPGAEFNKAQQAAAPLVWRALDSAGRENRSHVNLTLNTRPEGATVYKGREKLGTTPTTVKVDRDPKGESTVQFTFRLDGYKKGSTELIPDKDRSASVTLQKRGDPKKGGGGGGNGDGLLDPW